MSIYDMEQWGKDGTFKADPGQEITEEVYNQMLNGLPPKDLPGQTALDAMRKYGITVHYGFLMGEPDRCDSAGQLYLAFGMSDYGKGKKYYYLGLAHEREKLNGMYYYFDCMNAFVNGYFKISEFKDEQEAIKTALDYEATLYKEEYRDGELINNAVIYDPFDIYETAGKEEE